MALQKSIVQDNGYSANYWRLVEVDINWENRNARIRLKGYKDEDTRRANPKSGEMAQKRYNIKNELFDRFFDVPDLSEIPNWEEDTPYNKGVLVQLDAAVWQATDSVPAATAPPPNSDKWAVDTDLRLNRELVYEYIKNNVEEFSGATEV
jgi:hypothetical protein